MDITRKDKIYVILQFLLFFAWIFDLENLKFRISENMHSLALICAGVGLGLLLTAMFQLRSKLSPFPSPREGAKLVTTGAFAFARHPIYSGLLFMAFGISVWLGSGYKLIISLFLYFLFLLKSRYEEQRLQEVFLGYADYKRNTGRFFPKFNWRI